MDVRDTEYIVFDVESVVDGALLSRVLYSGDELEPGDAVARYQEEAGGGEVFIPVTFHVPVSVAIARVGGDFRLRDVGALDTPQFRPQEIVRLFWKGVQLYSNAVLVDFNGRGFDLPLLTLTSFRFGISCPRYFNDPDRFGHRYRFTSKHIDLMEWMTEYGAYRMRGGLDLLAKMLGKPGKMDTKGNQVQSLFEAGKLQEINDYCLHDVLDTYFVFLRTRVMRGDLSLDDEQSIVEDSKVWLEEKVEELPALSKYLKAFGDWEPSPFM
ncbi:MAG: 3'-5' exonuclease [Planctomycetes bacterium]|nr:3'-5' exonuclease [Planctomycetota bacterium]